MRKSFLIILLLALGVTITYAKQKKTNNPTKISFISMNRGACFGRCPDYRIEIYESGLVKYFGYMFVKDTGVFQKNIGAAKAIAIFKKFEEYRADTCQKMYTARIEDLPTLYYTIKYKTGEEQEINNAHFGPPFLKELAKDIDAAIKVDRSWKKIAKVAKR